MLKHLFLFILCSLSVVPAVWASADDDYTPFVREGSEWGYYYGGTLAQNDPDKNFYFHIQGDTSICGIEYKKMNLKIGRSRYYYDPAEGYVYDSHFEKYCYLAVREENKRVYAVRLDDIEPYAFGKVFEPDVPGPYRELTGEGVLYDFNDPFEFALELNVARYGNTTEYYRNRMFVWPVDESDDPCVKVEGRNGWLIRNRSGGIGRCGTIFEGIGNCPPVDEGNVAYLEYNARCCTRGNLIYMRNNEGVYEYIADGVEVTDIEKIRTKPVRIVARVVNGVLQLDLPDNTGSATIDVLTLGGKTLARGSGAGGRAEIAVNHLNADVYIVLVRARDYRANMKIRI